MSVYSSIVQRWKQPTCLPANEWITPEQQHYLSIERAKHPCMAQLGRSLKHYAGVRR